jgi:hypothetical protein
VLKKKYHTTKEKIQRLKLKNVQFVITKIRWVLRTAVLAIMNFQRHLHELNRALAAGHKIHLAQKNAVCVGIHLMESST